MEVRVRFFSHLRDLAGRSELETDVPDGTTVSQLLDALYKENAALKGADKTLLVAAGVEFVDRGYQIRPGDEISLMPPVQGG